MPIKFDIIPERGLVVVRYFGFIAVDDTLNASQAYLAHPSYSVGQKQLVDMRSITGFEKDYVRFMSIQADRAERLACTDVQSIVVYIVTTPISQDMSAMFIKSWKDVGAVIPLVQDSETEALALLGQPEDSIENLLATLVK